MYLSPVSTTQTEFVAKFAAGVFYPAAILPPVHLDLRISSRIFEKIRNDPSIIFRGLGEGDL
jgi:hypothetical protein